MIVFDADRIGPWVSERTGGTWTPQRGAGIGLEKDGQLIAGVLYEDWNKANVVCHIAAEGSWSCNREFLWMIFDYPFTQLGVRRITVPVAEENVKSQQFVGRLGFELETKLKDAHPSGDIFIFKMTPDACRWLKLKEPHGQEQQSSGA